MLPLRYLISCALFVGLCASSQAANKYLRAGASGSGNGSDWTNAYTTAAAAETGAARGDVIYCAAGNVGSVVCNTAASGTSTITWKKATVADHGTETGWSDGYATGQTVFNAAAGDEAVTISTPYWIFDGGSGGGPNSWTSGHGFLFKSASPYNSPFGLVTFSGAGGDNCQFIACEIGEDTLPASGVQRCVYSATGVENITFTRCYMRRTGDVGITTLNSVGWVIEYCRLDRMAVYGVSHGTGIELSDTTTNFTIRWSLVTNLEASGWIGIYDTGSGAVDGLYIYGNIFANTSDYSGTYGNGIIYNVSGTTEPIVNVKVYNNTFANLNSSMVLGLTHADGGSSAIGGSSGTEFVNNIIYNVAGDAGYDGGTRSYNASDETVDGGSNTQTLSGNPFVDGDDSLDFRLIAATTAGQSLGSPYNVDMFGNTRGADGTWDRGAFEYGTAGDPPDAPTSPTATATSASSITVSWTDNDDDPDETSFRIERSLTTSTGFSEIGTAAANATSYVDSNLTPGTTYYYRIRARNAGGDSAYTSEANATTNSIAAVSTSSNAGPLNHRR